MNIKVRHHILVLAWAARQPGSKLPCDSTPCFPGSRWRSSPSTHRSRTSCPCAVSWPRRRFLTLAGSYLFTNWALFTRLTDIGVEKSACWCSAARKSVGPCAAPPRQWIDFSVFSPTSASTKLRKQCLTSGSLFPATCFTRPVLKVPGSGCFCALWVFELFFSTLCVYSRWPGISRVSFVKASPGFLKPATIYLWKVMAERGALSLLSLLCLTFLHTETTAAKHVDKGTCLQHNAALLYLCSFSSQCEKLSSVVSRVRGQETHGMRVSRNQTWQLIVPSSGQPLFHHLDKFKSGLLFSWQAHTQPLYPGKKHASLPCPLYVFYVTGLVFPCMLWMDSQTRIILSFVDLKSQTTHVFVELQSTMRICLLGSVVRNVNRMAGTWMWEHIQCEESLVFTVR